MKLGFIALLGLACISSFGQTTSIQHLTPGYYVVVSAYLTGQEAYAVAYSVKINKEGRHSSYGFDATRNLYYVYLDRYMDFNESIGHMLKARQEGFDHAWVRIMKGDIKNEKETPVVENKNPAPTPVVEAPVAPVKENVPVVKKDVEIRTQVETKETTPVKEAVAPSTSVKSQTAVVEISNSGTLIHPQLLRNSTVLLTLYNPTNNAQIEGDVEVVDAERAKLISKVKGNDFLMLPDPKSKSGKLLLISNSFGYRIVQHELNYKSTEKDTVPSFLDIVDNHYRIKFDMDRLHMGDIAVLSNVYFYNDAAIMLPESRYELNKLLQMMKDNPTLTITLHGHTNGNGQGKIITMSNPTDFFTLSSTAKQGFGSAKELSRVRAQVIKDWLISNGVSADRMLVNPHGGKRMIHDKNSGNAKRNVRVEVEVTHE